MDIVFGYCGPDPKTRDVANLEESVKIHEPLGREFSVARKDKQVFLGSKYPNTGIHLVFLE